MVVCILNVGISFQMWLFTLIAIMLLQLVTPKEFHEVGKKSEVMCDNKSFHVFKLKQAFMIACTGWKVPKNNL